MYTLKSKKELPHSEIEIEVEIPFEELEKDRKTALTEISADIDIPGFRKGQVPENIIIDKIGEEYILEKTSQKTLNRVFPQILEKEKIEVIAPPSITVTKLAAGNPFEFKAQLVTMPEVKLPDYKKMMKEIMGKEDSLEVTDSEVEDYINAIRKNRAQAVKNAAAKEGEQAAPVADEDLPALDDEFVKTLGVFESVEDFKTKVRENLVEEKKVRSSQKKRVEIMEAIIAGTTMNIPEIIIENELDKMMGQFEDDTVRMGIKSEDYLKHINKTREDLRKDWREDADKRARMNIILPEIAAKEKLTPDINQVAYETNHLVQHHGALDENRVRLYVYSTLANERVFQFFEGIEPKPFNPEEHDFHGHNH